MALKRRSWQEEAGVMGDINVTPMVDIMLVLLIVFIITAPVMHQAFKMNLPQASAEKIQTEPSKVLFEIASDGSLSIDGVPGSAESVFARLSEAVKNDPETAVHIHADEAVPYGTVAKAMAGIRESGAARMLFVTSPEKAEKR